MKHDRQLVTTVVDALEDLKGVDIQVLDVREMTSITDYMVVVSGNSSRHVKGLADHVLEKAREIGVRPLGVEGEREAEWLLVDLGDVVIHVMRAGPREFYKLERLWDIDKQAAAVAED
jgi:ribosome-associated protein